MENDYSHLMIGYLQSTLSKEEMVAFRAWVNANPDNKKLFFEVKAVYDACLTENRAIDINASWLRLLKKKQQSKRFFTLLKKAGGVCCCHFISCWYHFFTFCMDSG